MSKYMMMPRLLHKYTHELNVVVQDLVDTIEKQKQDGGHRVDDVLGILHAWAFESEYVDVCTYIHAHKHLLSICVCVYVVHVMPCTCRHCPVCSGKEIGCFVQF